MQIQELIVKESKKWVKDLREVAFGIEDIIDQYLNLNLYGDHEPQLRDPGCEALLSQIFHFIKTLIPRHQIASEIQNIKSHLLGIKTRSIEYHFQEQGSSSSHHVKWHDPRIASLYIEEADVVGFEGQRDKLIGWLVKDLGAERTVISVVGMGGQGKTTLVKKVFDNHKVIGHFHCHAWITVSQSYTVEALLRDMLKQFCKEAKENPPEGISTMDLKSLIDEVRSYLQQKRYVVVFDYVWDVLFWNEIEFALIDDQIGSRILITTRKMDIVDTCKQKTPYTKVHEMEPLTQDKALELLYKNAFKFDFNGCYPEEFSGVSAEILNKCDHLPLAIVTIGGLLYTKERSVPEWVKFSRNLSSNLEKDPHLIGVEKILGFSYDDLPSYMKPCLLYFGMYPEDYQVKSKSLIRQWIAEGFVKDEEVGEEYLIELINRSLVQVSSFTIDGAKAKKCRVHNLLRGIILRKSKELCFCQHISQVDLSVFSGIIRRLSISINSFNDLMGSSNTRSLFVFGGTKSLLPYNFVLRIPTKHRLLKVLHIEDGQLDFVPEEWGNLTYLRYLCLRNTWIHNYCLPKAIGKLHNLETLDLRGADAREIPKEICMLKKLQHLLGNRIPLIQLKDGIGEMKSLQTLFEVRVDEDGMGEVIQELGNLTELRELGLFGVRTEHENSLSSSITKMKQLEKLQIITKSSDEVIDLRFIPSPPTTLRKLPLRGKLNKLPDWIPKLPNFVKLYFQSSALTNDPLKSLQDMSNLLSLTLASYSYEGESLHFQDLGFPKLKELKLKGLYNLHSISIDSKALPSLKKLTLSRIPKLKRVPSDIQYLRNLEYLDFHYMSTEFDKSIAPIEGSEGSPIIKHVPQSIHH
ncbi:Virus X resistance protein-like, coiled-coil domain [Sesbania bispinosa]|nr:Virus X resistance protein-like, coiled-coil domain [Sesbania bispinosa]